MYFVFTRSKGRVLIEAAWEPASDGALRLNVHPHTLALDGVYVRNADKTLEFHALAPPTTAEVHALAKRMHARLERLCVKHGLRDELRDEPGEEATALAVCMNAAAQRNKT